MDFFVDDWIAATVLPNINLDEPIESGLIALVPRHDKRVVALCKAYRDRIFKYTAP